MSPAPQGNLEVERYIGSCLISQRIQPNNSLKNLAQHTRHYHNQHGKQKSIDSPTGDNKNRNYDKYQNFTQRSASDHNHARGAPKYSLRSGSLPMSIECNGFGNGHYARHSSGSGSGWAGMPLISMTSSNPRRNKKILPTTNDSQSQRSHKSAQQNISYLKTHDRIDTPHSDADRSPLTRLAIHTQGAPLIQAGRYNSNTRCRNNFSRDPSLRVYRGGDVRAVDTTKDTRNSPENQNKDPPSGNIDCLSVASDESSGNSENNLPRIIKPRKRRKKDRKPLTANINTSSQTSSNESKSFEEHTSMTNSPKSKTYLSRLDSSNAQSLSESKQCALPARNNVIKSQEDGPSEDLIDPIITSAEEFQFGNLLDEQEDSHSELSSCAPATVCQCRYCDPSGVIWDVDQRCYSPYLTPPSPTDNKVHFSSSLPLEYHCFDQVTRSYNQQLKMGSPTYSLNCDLGSLLRRSWSDPSSYKNTDISQLSNSPERLWPEYRPSSPQSLQVSSEIVTSPNGHRDIEIKFYSSSSAPDSSSCQLSFSGSGSGRTKISKGVDVELSDHQVAEE